MTPTQAMFLIAAIGVASACIVGLFAPLMLKAAGAFQSVVGPRLDHFFTERKRKPALIVHYATHGHAVALDAEGHPVEHHKTEQELAHHND